MGGSLLAGVSGEPSIRAAATAAASMFATGATNSAGSEEPAIYSSSRRASSSRLIAEISASSRCACAPVITRRRTSRANASGT